MKRYSLCLLTAFVLMPAFVHAQDKVKEQPITRFVVPFELIKTQHMVVKVTVNGKGPYRVIFDTGAPDNIISSKLANEAEVLGKGKKASGGLFGGGKAKIANVELADLKLENVSCMIVDHPTVQAIASIAGKIDGIIGFSFYSRYRMSIDYEKSEMTFEPNDYKPGDIMNELMAKFTAPKAVREAPRILAPSGLLGFRVEKAKEDEEAGVNVKDVLAGSAAEKAGFKSGDRLLTLDGRWTDTVNDCYLASSLISVGSPVAARVLRDGKVLKLKLTVRAGL